MISQLILPTLANGYTVGNSDQAQNAILVIFRKSNAKIALHKRKTNDFCFCLYTVSGESVFEHLLIRLCTA